MLRDEFNRLIHLFKEGAAGNLVNLEEVFAQSVEFFNHLKAQVENGGPEEKKEALQLMTEFHQRMTEESKKIAERSGLSEEQLVTYAENPANFTPKQWEAIQESKSQISQAGHNLARTLYEKGRELPPEALHKEEKKKPLGPKKPKKSSWIRS